MLYNANGTYGYKVKMETRTKHSVNKNNARKDGDATKALIIECAGRLIAVKGYAAVTSKMVCEKAGVNLAAINYHFGSRDGLYVAVLEEVHQHLLSLDFLQGLIASDLTPHARLEKFIDTFVAAVYNEDNWYVRVWAREIVSPSPFLAQIISQEALPKFSILKQIFSEILGLKPDDPALTICMLSVMAPFVLIFLANWKILGQVVSQIEVTPEQLVTQLKQFAFAGLKAYVKP